MIQGFEWDVRICKVNGYFSVPPKPCFHKPDKERIAKIIYEPENPEEYSRWTLFIIEK